MQGSVTELYRNGYYYDVETGRYATDTRSYVPEIGRFINSDGTCNPRLLKKIQEGEKYAPKHISQKSIRMFYIFKNVGNQRSCF